MYVDLQTQAFVTVSIAVGPLCNKFAESFRYLVAFLFPTLPPIAIPTGESRA